MGKNFIEMLDSINISLTEKAVPARRDVLC